MIEEVKFTFYLLGKTSEKKNKKNWESKSLRSLKHFRSYQCPINLFKNLIRDGNVKPVK